MPDWITEYDTFNPCTAVSLRAMTLAAFKNNDKPKSAQLTSDLHSTMQGSNLEASKSAANRPAPHDKHEQKFMLLHPEPG